MNADDDLLALAARAGAVDTAKPWAPLADDGDAFRLAVKLEMLVDIRRDKQRTDVLCSTRGRMFKGATDHMGDAAAATRRAIVELAAQVGGMP